jgi:hypothetical protein
MATETRTDNKTGMNRVPMLPLILAGGAGLVVIAARARNTMRSKGTAFKRHQHDALEHTHEHVHVTHNRSEPGKPVGGWQHLTAEHIHAHNHPGLEHSHRPHKDFSSEHRSEAHIHDHEHPTTSWP